MDFTMKYGVCAVILLTSTRVGTGQTWIQVTSLHDTLFAGYNPDIRPINTQSDAINVNVSFQLFNIDEYNSVSGVLSLVAVLNIAWKDEILTWTPGSYGGLETLIVNQTKIWRPNLYNLKVAEMFRPISNDHFRAEISSDGTIHWNPGGLLKVKCPPDAEKFPFDSQTCSVDLTPWGYDATEILLASTNSYIDLSYYDTSGEYDIDSTSAEASSQGQISFVQFKVSFSRIPLYHVINTIFPVILILLLNPLVFILPSASGERVSYSLTVLLSFTVFLTIVNAVLPSVSDPMSVLSYFTIISMIISAGIAALTIFQLHFYYKTENDSMTKCLFGIFRYLQRKRRCGCKHRTVANDEQTDTVKTEQTIELDTTDEKPQWNEFVMTFDKLFLISFYIVIVIFVSVSLIYIGT